VTEDNIMNNNIYSFRREGLLIGPMFLIQLELCNSVAIDLDLNLAALKRLGAMSFGAVS
jgi:hypothetical protein